MLSLLLACASTPSAPSVAPADWFYADTDGSIDWESVDMTGPEADHRVRGGDIDTRTGRAGPAS